LTEKQVRARLAQLEQELADEKTKNERAQQTIADLAQAAAWDSRPHPVTFPADQPPPVQPIQLPWAITAYMAAFPPSITYEGVRPNKGNKVK
jgi:hypothetical protein